MGRHLHAVKRIAALAATLFLMRGACAAAVPEEPDGGDFSVQVLQRGEERAVIDHSVRLQKKAFTIVVHFSKPMGILVGAALNDRTWLPAVRREAIDDLPAFRETGMAEGRFNDQNDILLSDRAPSYWYYENPDDHRFNTVRVDKNGITAFREIESFYDVSTRASIPVARAEAPLYLVFISYEHGENWERKEIHRQCVKIEWE